jgi:hypothetical protein
MKKPTKKDMVKHALESGRGVTGLSAIRDFNLYRLSSAIHELRKEGMDIETIDIPGNGTTFAEYRLANG